MFEPIKRAWAYTPVRWAMVISGATAAMLLLLPGMRMGGFSPDGFLPHATCYLRDPRVIWLHVTADSFIAIAYLSISATLGYIVYRARHDIPFHWMFVAFGLFIVACGVTHIMAVITVWRPVYWLSGDIKAITAVASVTTAVVLPATVPHIFSLIHDAKASDQHKRDLEAAHEKLKESDELKSRFFANVSHELRTPLSLILGPLRQRLASGDLGAEERVELEVAERNAALLLQQVNNLLDLAKLEAGGMKPRYARADLASLARLVASYFESLAAERNIRFQVQSPETLPAEVDPGKTQRIFLNLLSNAFKFTPDAGTIRCTVEAADDRCVFVIEDSGPGIPVPLREAVFERFRQVEGGATRKVGGTGLGLPIAREFAELHGGAIALGDSELGGARFEVDLPCRAPEGTPVDESAGPLGLNEARPATAELRSYTPPAAERDHDDAVAEAEHDNRPLVLVVEDNPDMNAFIAATLGARYRVARAVHGREGLDKAHRLQPDLIVTDIMMPEMSGDQMIERLRADPTLADIPVVVLTAKADDEQRVRLIGRNVRDHLVKPFRPDELLARVSGVVEHRLETIRKLRELNASLERRVAERTRQVQEQAHQLRHLAAELGSTEQRERRRLAQALHDHLQQLLVSARMTVERAMRASDTREAADLLEQVLRTLDQSIQASRNLTVELYPPVLYDRGLGAALEWLSGHAHQQHGLRVHVHVEPDADPPDQDLQAFLFSAAQELLLNVVKHAKTEEAEVNMSKQDERVVLTVEDHGVGCEMEDALRNDASRQGFGLFNIRERLRILGGVMNIRSRPDGGCRVELWCPLDVAGRFGSPGRGGANADDTTDAEGGDEPRPAPADAGRRMIRVMIVDDHKILREGLSGILAGEEGIAVVAEAADGREAIDAIDDAAPDVVIMDVSMPRMDGVEATQWITREKPDIRVVALSMHQKSDMTDAMLRAGAVTYLTKGGPASELVDAIRHAAT